MSEPALAVHDLCYQIREHRILEAVSFTVDEGAYLSVIGPNGAGKSTLLRCLNRIVDITAGDIELFGAPLPTYSQKRLGGLISYVPQADSREFQFTVREFVTMGRYPHLKKFGALGRHDLERVEWALETTGTGVFSDRSLNTLSGGERQKVLIAAALAQEARILLLDEPTTYLDYRHQIDITTLLRELNRQTDITIITVTHNLNQAVFMGSRVLALKEGRIIFQGQPAELYHSEVLQNIYDTAFRFLDDPITGFPLVVPEAVS